MKWMFRICCYIFLISKCRAESDLGMCITSGLAKWMPLRIGDFWWILFGQTYSYIRSRHCAAIKAGARGLVQRASPHDHWMPRGHSDGACVKHFQHQPCAVAARRPAAAPTPLCVVLFYWPRGEKNQKQNLQSPKNLSRTLHFLRRKVDSNFADAIGTMTPQSFIFHSWTVSSVSGENKRTVGRPKVN